MTIRPVLRMGEPLLFRQAAPVTDFSSATLHELVRDLWDTMARYMGAGIAAPQIGVSLQVIVFGFEKNARYPDAPAVPRTVLINPHYTPLGEEKSLGWEGCLSVPGLRGEVPRYESIRYQGLDLQGQPVDRTATGFHARLVQHECDHLIGRLFPSRITDFTRFGYTEVLFPEL